MAVKGNAGRVKGGGLAALTASVLAGLAVPAGAEAGQWGWSGFIGSGNDNPGCWWHHSVAVCGTNYWSSLKYGRKTNNSGGTKALIGFENPSAIRGLWVNTGQGRVSYSTSPAALGFGTGNYTGCHVTWWSGAFMDGGTHYCWTP